MTDSLSEVFWSHKIALKKSRNIYFFLLKKAIAISRWIFEYCVSNIHFLCQILLSTQYYKIYTLIEITFLSKIKYISRSFFLCNFVLPKTYAMLCVNINHDYTYTKLCIQRIKSIVDTLYLIYLLIIDYWKEQNEFVISFFWGRIRKKCCQNWTSYFHFL